MAYIEAHQSLRDHRKILALAAELDMEEAHVAGHCLFLWLWSLDNAEDGILPSSERIIERAAGWHGASSVFVAAMVKVNMLDKDEDGTLSIHDWWDYAGRLIEKRHENAERMREARARKSSSDSENSSRTPDERATHVQRTLSARAGARVPYRTVPNTTVPESREPKKSVRRKVEPTIEPTPADDGASAPQPRTSTPSRTRNEHWDALVAVFGYEPATAQEKGKWGKVMNDLKESHATPDDMRRAKANYDAALACGAINWTLTPMALAAHLGELLSGPATSYSGRNSRPRAAAPSAPREPPMYTRTPEDVVASIRRAPPLDPASVTISANGNGINGNGMSANGISANGGIGGINGH